MTGYAAALSSPAKLFLALAAILFSLSSSNVYLFYIATKPVKFPYKSQVMKMKQQGDAFIKCLQCPLLLRIRFKVVSGLKSPRAGTKSVCTLHSEGLCMGEWGFGKRMGISAL